MDELVELPAGRGGGEILRSSRGVHRTAGPWTPTVHAFLRHLESARFTAAPRVVGMDEAGREIVTYIDGEVLADPAWQPGQPTPWPPWAQTEEVLSETGRLLANLHAAAADFRPADPVWKQYDWPVLLDGEIVCHGDIGPHNTVYRAGRPVAFIDWDVIRPDLPLIEFGNAAWRFVPLGDERYFAASGFRRVPALAERLAIFAAAYGVTDPDDVLWALQHSKQRAVETFRQWPLTAETAATALRFVAAELDWLDANADELLRALP